MKALTLTQPWATAIVIGNKQVETRSWKTKYRGWIAIHAAVRVPGWAKFFAEIERACWRLPNVIPLGAVLGYAVITDMQRTEDVVESISDLEKLYGDYSPGRWAWILSDVIKLDEPIPAKGALGLWEWHGVKDVGAVRT